VGVGTRVFFQADDGTTGDELWVSDGTWAGTYLVKDINPGPAPSNPSDISTSENASMRAWGENVAFKADDGVHGWELWVSDGTANGTYRVRDLQPGAPSSYPQGIRNAEGALFFSADNGISGRELWKTDGTSGGTFLVRDIWPGSGGSYPGDLVSVGPVVLFRAYSGPASNGEPNAELWRSDGTFSGTFLVRDNHPTSGSWPDALTRYNGKVYFQAYDAQDDQELWVSDGTFAGTYRLKDINPTGSSAPWLFTEAGGYLFFGAYDDVHGQEQWVTDGTEVGTHMIKDVNPSGDGFWSGTTECAGRFYFSPDDGEHGKELWVTDLTQEGTYLLFDLLPGLESSYAVAIACLAGRLIFVGDDGINGRELWALDLDIPPIPASTPVMILISTGGLLAAGALLIRRRGFNRVGPGGRPVDISHIQEERR
jgi:ELWxxDGT repeat protein